MSGMWFEEFQIGRVVDHPITRTITENDNMWFCNLTYNTQPLHIDFHRASKSEFGKPIVNSLFTLGLLVGITVTDTTLGTTVANLGFEEVSFPAPVFHGDTLRVRTTVLNVRESKSRPRQGIVELLHEGFNQEDKLVARCKRSALMHKRPLLENVET